MAKNDFHVIVYQILAYLYQSLKSGKDIDTKMLSAESIYFRVDGEPLNEKYWAYIIYNLQRLRLIEGVILGSFDGLKHPYPVNLEACMITPAGIEYLTDNSFISKARDFLKDVKAIVPFV